MKKKKEKKTATERKKNSQKKHIVPLIVLLVAVLVAAAYYYYQGQKYAKACFSGKCFYLEVARTPEERARGLMYRESLDADKGMLFIFEKEGDYAFWMKNTLIPLDIIWINADKRIVHISKNTPPCMEVPCPVYSAGTNALYVIELNSGAADELGLLVGDKVMIS